MKHSSGSPSAWSQRKKDFEARSGQVSNPGQPSPVNRKARRQAEAALRPIAQLARIAVLLGADAEKLAPLTDPSPRGTDDRVTCSCPDTPCEACGL